MLRIEVGLGSFRERVEKDDITYGKIVRMNKKLIQI